jgi:hypothetical protein
VASIPTAPTRTPRKPEHLLQLLSRPRSGQQVCGRVPVGHLASQAPPAALACHETGGHQLTGNELGQRLGERVYPCANQARSGLLRDGLRHVVTDAVPGLAGLHRQHPFVAGDVEAVLQEQLGELRAGEPAAEQLRGDAELPCVELVVGDEEEGRS